MKDNYMIYIVVALVVLVGGFVLFQNMAPQTTDEMPTQETTIPDMVTPDELMMDDTVMPEDEMVMESQSIVEIAAGDPNFSTLVAAVTEAGLVDTLSGEGPFTVFAPTNDAFAALPEGTLEALLADPEALTSVLTYHVVQGAVTSDAVVNLDAATTVNGQDISISVSEMDGVMINDATVVIPDIMASNGVIHVIDTVLIPQ